MPGVTADMLWWWFAWHCLDPFRYSIWDPEDHFSVKVDDEGRRRSLDPNVPLKEKTWGDPYCHGIHRQYPDEITIMFKNPAEMGLDISKSALTKFHFWFAPTVLWGR
jgi:hypothetical protein